MMQAYEPWDAARGAEIIAEHTDLEGATLVILHALQEAFGYVPEPAIPMIASALNLSRAEVHGVFTFYHDFRHRPAGRHVLKLCRAEPGYVAVLKHPIFDFQIERFHISIDRLSVLQHEAALLISGSIPVLMCW